MLTTSTSPVSVPVVPIVPATPVRTTVQNVDAYFASYDSASHEGNSPDAVEQRVDDNLNNLESLFGQYAQTIGAASTADAPATSQAPTTAVKPAGKLPYYISPLRFDPPAGFKLSIVIPAFNEARTIGQVLDRVFALPVEKEVIVIDDCSLDGTGRILRSMLGRPGLRVLFKEKNEGKCGAARWISSSNWRCGCHPRCRPGV